MLRGHGNSQDKRTGRSFRKHLGPEQVAACTPETLRPGDVLISSFNQRLSVVGDGGVLSCESGSATAPLHEVAPGDAYRAVSLGRVEQPNPGVDYVEGLVSPELGCHSVGVKTAWWALGPPNSGTQALLLREDFRATGAPRPERGLGNQIATEKLAVLGPDQPREPGGPRARRLIADRAQHDTPPPTLRRGQARLGAGGQDRNAHLLDVTEKRQTWCVPGQQVRIARNSLPSWDHTAPRVLGSHSWDQSGLGPCRVCNIGLAHVTATASVFWTFTEQ
ncbi:hypothetical protein CB1_000896006 [Camelus ferus]|nr:hypothetical protein CB1_000896006 [Camelus ferus]